jgi:Ca-activated chloride channel family protein
VGTLTPAGASHVPLQVRDHAVRVVLQNGFAKTEVQQTFFNPNPHTLEAIYEFPLPKGASLSEMSVTAGERELKGEVVEKTKADELYEEQQRAGGDAGKAEKDGIQVFRFRVSQVPAQGETRVRFVYYQPLEIDTGVGRYLYPLEEGGTDDAAAASFWTRNPKVEGRFSFDLELKSSWPVTEVRMPGCEATAQVSRLEEGHYRISLNREGADLNRDLVVYYRLQDDLPGRVELIGFRADKGKPGTFMMVVTPGLDLNPLTQGADYVFVLDVSGSMQSKIHTLGHGVSQALGKMQGNDRFRIITFNDNARDITGGWKSATPEAVKAWMSTVEGLRADGSTNLYEGLAMALKGLDDDRATSIVLVTDGVTNTGEITPQAFHKLMKAYDVRVFGFLMGNSANWPLMDTICKASGGFSAGVSNDDDIIGQILLAKSKITHECLHDAVLKVGGVKVFDETDACLGKVYRGQQLVIFGRYEGAGKATVTLKARLTGQDKAYTTTFDFPEVDTENPEIERLWALSRIDEAQVRQNAGLLPEAESRTLVRDLGVAYQLVTDETSMIVLSDEVFAQKGIERRNVARAAAEQQAQAVRSQAPVKNHRVDAQAPMFSHPAPSFGGGGGGALDPMALLLVLCLAGLAVALLLRPQETGRLDPLEPTRRD